MNSFPLHVGDYIRDTVGLSMIEDGAYSRLLNQYYASERPLPLEKDKQYRMARANTPEERAAVDYIVPTYFMETPEGWISKRAEEELAKIRDRSQSARKSVEARWGKRGTPEERALYERNTNVSETYGKRNTSQNPITNNHNPEDSAREGEPLAFTVFMESYPNPEAPDAALREWNFIRPSIQIEAQIMRNLNLYKKSDNWQNARYVPKAAKWLHDGSWKVEPNGSKPEPSMYQELK